MSNGRGGKYKYFFALLILIGIFVTIFVFLKKAGVISINVPITKQYSAKKCIRNSPYPTEPEFERVISLTAQRIKQRSPDYKEPEYSNCIHIQYGDLKTDGTGPEGVFVFDKSISTPNDLVIYVDKSYKSNDDLLTAILVVHEITHAQQFYNEAINGENTISCVDKETDAFMSELLLLYYFNAEERESIIYRSFGKEISNTALMGTNQIITIFVNSGLQCKKELNCALNLSRQKIREWIIKDPFYIKLCNLK